MTVNNLKDTIEISEKLITFGTFCFDNFLKIMKIEQLITESCICNDRIEHFRKKNRFTEPLEIC